MASAHLLTDRTTGRCVVVTGWQDMAALAASRAATARLRADAAAHHLQVRAVEEYALVFTSIRDSDTRSLIERDIELWNARDQEGWMAGMNLPGATVQMPGGIQLTGEEAAGNHVEHLARGVPGQPDRDNRHPRRRPGRCPRVPRRRHALRHPARACRKRYPRPAGP